MIRSLHRRNIQHVPHCFQPNIICIPTYQEVGELRHMGVPYNVQADRQHSMKKRLFSLRFLLVRKRKHHNHHTNINEHSILVHIDIESKSAKTDKCYFPTYTSTIYSSAYIQISYVVPPMLRKIGLADFFPTYICSSKPHSSPALQSHRKRHAVACRPEDIGS